jgi:hypothetical protein
MPTYDFSHDGFVRRDRDSGCGDLSNILRESKFDI